MDNFQEHPVADEKEEMQSKIKQLQAELGKRDRKIENMYHAIHGIQNDDCRMWVHSQIESRQKEDARTVEPMFKASLESEVK